MALIVQKFGGTSVANIEKIKNVAEKVIKVKQAGHQVVVVLSAMAGETDRLINLAHSATDLPDEREYDSLISTGEQVTVTLLAIVLNAMGCKARSFLGFQVKILTDQAYKKARISLIDTENIKKELKKGTAIVIAGFQGVDKDNNITTLGRGGSDTSAVALAAALRADQCDIYTDVDGVYTTDPNVCNKARRLEKISYDEMLEMASLGANVLHSRAVEIAKKYSVRLRCASTFSDKGGTMVTSTYLEAPVVSGLSVMRDQTQITLSNLEQGVEQNKEVFAVASAKNWNIDMISIIQLNNHLDIAFTVVESVIDDVIATYETIFKPNKNVRIKAQTGFSKISVVGLGMRTASGVASRFFSALAKGSINVKMVTTSEIKISVLIPQEQLETAVECLSEEFELCSE